MNGSGPVEIAFCNEGESGSREMDEQVGAPMTAGDGRKRHAEQIPEEARQVRVWHSAASDAVH